MKRALKCFIVFIVALFVAQVSAQQTRDQRATPPQPAGPAGTAALSGVVTSEDGSRPVRFAYIVLLGTGTGTVKVSATDTDGRFMFANLPADRYVVGAIKPPYLGTVHGAKRPGRSGSPIALADGQKLSNVAIRMALGASIAGVVTDERGQPAANVEVSVQQLRMQGGERTLVPPAGGARSFAMTDDLGRYRLFGLLPGEYMVAVTRGVQFAARALTVSEVDAALQGKPVTASPAPANVRYAPVYFPGTTRPGNAVPIALGSGEERTNADIKLELAQTAKVEGTVVGADGQMMTAGTVILVSSGASLLRTSLSIRILPDGRFSVPGVSPGSYVAFSPGTGPNANHYAATAFEVVSGDVLGLQLTMRPTMSLPGRMEFRGNGVAPSLAGRRIPVRPINPLAGVPSPTITATNERGAFTMSNILPGTYVIGAPLSFGPTTDSMTWALESVIADGRDITDKPIDLMADTLPKDLVVTYSDRFQELGGRLSRADGSPVSEYTIIVFPEDKAYWVTGSRRIVTTRPGTDGRFTLSGAGPTTLPPGKYLLAAVTDIDRNEQFDPAFLASIAPVAAPITLQPGEKKVQDLVVK